MVEWLKWWKRKLKSFDTSHILPSHNNNNNKHQEQLSLKGWKIVKICRFDFLSFFFVPFQFHISIQDDCELYIVYDDDVFIM